jgi:uncharacterized membrane protein YdjX (TVP38/TMEM64 family)
MTPVGTISITASTTTSPQAQSRTVFTPTRYLAVAGDTPSFFVHSSFRIGPRVFLLTALVLATSTLPLATATVEPSRRFPTPTPLALMAQTSTTVPPSLDTESRHGQYEHTRQYGNASTPNGTSGLLVRCSKVLPNVRNRAFSYETSMASTGSPLTIPSGGGGTATLPMQTHTGTTSAIHTVKENTVYTLWRNPRTVLYTCAILVTLVPLYSTRASWIPFFQKERIQAQTIQILRRFQDTENETLALLQYTLGMTIWEFFGLSTIPVETAAGMVFGWKAAIASGIGKLVGAVLTFVITQVILRDRVQARLVSNPLFQLLLEQSPKRHHDDDDRSKCATPVSAKSSSSSVATVASPWQTSVCLKFSCVPELVKNCGSALLNIPLWIFMAVTVGHGWTYTALWTWTGVDAAAQLLREDGAVPVHGSNLPLQIALAMALLIGVVGSPLLMAWWIRELRRTSIANKSAKHQSQVVRNGNLYVLP